MNTDALYAIQHADPDGGERKPTDEDYAAHKAWAIRNFGEAVWRIYATGGWGETWDEPRHVEY